MSATQVHLVQVTTDSRQKRIWMVAAPQEDAVSIVLDAVPEGWTASLLPLKPVEGSSLNMQVGDMRELTR